MKANILTVVLLLAVLLMLGFACGGEAVVTFLDPNLEAAIREEIGKPTGDIYQSDLAMLTELDAERKGISDLTGLEHCISLTTLELVHNQISDISPLSGLTSLTELDLWDNQISDITPLSSLTSLTRLDLEWNQISNIKPLVDNAWLSSGDYVYLWGNPLSATSLDTYIPELEARGVWVAFNTTPVSTPAP